MDSANKQSAVISETTMGTTPATPAFKLLRDIRVSGAPDRPAQRSPERIANRQAANMVSGLFSISKSIETPFVRDAANDVLLESVFGNTWATNALKVGSTKKSFTLEEKYSATTPPYRRATGCMVNTLQLSFPMAGGGNPGTMSFACLGMAEASATTAIASSTYTTPSPYNDPTSLIDVTFGNLFSITSPKVTGFQMSLTNNLRNLYSHGAASPFDIGFGQFDVTGQVQLYFSQASDYSTFMTRQTGLALDVTIGSVANQKDRIQMNTVDVWNPSIDDPGATGDHILTLNFMGRYNATDASALIWTRNVA